MVGTTKVDIWNLALSHIGQRPIASDTENSVMALACARSWDTARREALRNNAWGFAMVVENLSLISTYTPPTQWLYGYQYPSNCIAIRKVYSPSSIVYDQRMPGSQVIPASADPKRANTGEKFREIFVPSLNAKVILSNSQDAIIEYTYDLQDTTLYDAIFVTLMGWRVGADVSTPLTGDASIAVNLMKIYAAQLSEAQRMDSYEDNTGSMGDSSMLDARA